VAEGAPELVDGDVKRVAHLRRRRVGPERQRDLLLRAPLVQHEVEQQLARLGRREIGLWDGHPVAGDLQRANAST
jgi:hypothetical protein